MKKVLIVAGKLVIGGAELVCRNIGFFADSIQFQIDYLVFGDEIGDYEDELLEKGCRIYHWEEPGKSHVAFYRQLVALLREQRYDVVHCHTMFNSGIVLRAAKHCEVPIRIAHSHSIRGPEPRGFVKNLYEKTMRRWILRDATHKIGCGTAAGEWLFGKEAFQREGIVLLNGIDLEHFRFDPICRDRLRRDLGWEDAFVIGHTGHLATVKNQIFLLRLMPELLKQKPNARLVLLGEGEDRTMLENVVSDLKLETAVRMPGSVQNVNEYLNAMDVFAFPSLYEGTPLSILEVQANGLPCVISDRVPKDVFLTDLLWPLPLENSARLWIDALLTARRRDPERYLTEMQQSNADVHQMLNQIFHIYRGESE